MVRAIAGCVLGVLLLSTPAARAEGEFTNMLANSSFESGRATPYYWNGFGFGPRNWEFHGHDGQRCISVAGNGMDTGWWYAERWVQVKPSELYRLSYWVRGEAPTADGRVVAGLNLVNSASSAGSDWEKRQFFFRSPEWLPDLQLRLGQDHINGKVYFDEAELHPAVAIHRSRGIGGLSLGAGESIMDGVYTAVHAMSGKTASDCRFLNHFSGKFDTDRWILGGADEVVYRHQIDRLGMPELDEAMRAAPMRGGTVQVAPGHVVSRRPVEITQNDTRSLRAFRQKGATIAVVVDRCEKGRLSVDVSRDGKLWARIGEIDKPGMKRLSVPGHLMPARDVWVRLKSDYAGRIEVTGYRYSSTVEKAAAHHNAVGHSQYLAVVYAAPDVRVLLTDVGDLVPGGRREVKAIIHNSGDRRKLRATAIIKKDEEIVSESEKVFPVGAGGARRVYLPYTVDPSGEQVLRIILSDTESGKLLSLLEGRFVVPALRDAAGGELLSGDPALTIWWCEPERKVSEIRPPPATKGTALRIRAAGNEYEAAQLVLRPSDWLHKCSLRVSDLVAESGSRIPSSQVEVRRAEYVLVTQCTDDVGDLGRWPDPLPPLSAPVDLCPGRNHPFWITVHAPPGTPAGDYHGEIAIEAEEAEQRVPLAVHVWGFDLPEETHVRTRLGLSQRLIKSYHNLETEEDLRRVLDLYLQSFRSHRVSPAWVGQEIDVEWKRAAGGKIEPALDFSSFDEEARRALDEVGIDSFALKLSGTEEIAGFKRRTLQHETAFFQYAHAVEEHLDERGWLGRALVYYPDGRGQRSLQVVRRELDLIHRAVPEFTRVLTMSPSPRLHGAADVWCIPVAEFAAESAEERQRAGKEVWWSLSQGAEASCIADFLDHYGTEMRLWLWATWKYKLDGILMREANCWDSDTAYPRPAVQNPWDDPMSWQSQPGLPEGARVARGNGDGRLLYPPNRDPMNDRTKHLEGPVPSIRWELLRDGVEDYEYFWLLQQQIERLKTSGAEAESYREAEELLEVPAEICSDPTRFTATPEPIHAHRAKLAEAIERLNAQ
ncbi:MAG: DUF4091 domain-containing protein [Armatimonadota bacterium]|nr:MAG: DUF4091 domain-containing protein [Armatimonadota bacterium]